RRSDLARNRLYGLLCKRVDFRQPVCVVTSVRICERISVFYFETAIPSRCEIVFRQMDRRPYFFDCKEAAFFFAIWTYDTVGSMIFVGIVESVFIFANNCLVRKVPKEHAG